MVASSSIMNPDFSHAGGRNLRTTFVDVDRIHSDDEDDEVSFCLPPVKAEDKDGDSDVDIIPISTSDNGVTSVRRGRGRPPKRSRSNSPLVVPAVSSMRNKQKARRGGAHNGPQRTSGRNKAKSPNGAADKQDVKKSERRVLTSNLPLVFASGKPRSLENLDLAELRRFFQFVLDCEREAQSDYVSDEDSKPDWWPKDLPFTEELWESQTKRGYWCSILRKAIKACYDHHDSGYLLEFSGRLMQYVETVSNVKLVDNSDGTRTLINAAKNKLLATFKSENQDYDKNHRNGSNGSDGSPPSSPFKRYRNSSSKSPSPHPPTPPGKRRLKPLLNSPSSQQPKAKRTRFSLKNGTSERESEVVEVEEENSNDVKSEVDDGEDSDVKIEEEIICESSSNNNKSTNRLQLCSPLKSSLTSSNGVNGGGSDSADGELPLLLDDYLCDNCDKGFDALQKLLDHEKLCKEPEGDTEAAREFRENRWFNYFKLNKKKNSDDDEDASKKPQQKTVLGINALVNMKRPKAGSYAKFLTIDITSPLGQYILSTRKKQKQIESQRLLERKRERELKCCGRASPSQEHTEGCTGKTEGSKDDDEDEEEEEDPSAIDLGVLCQKAKPGVTSGLRVNNYGVTCPKHIRREYIPRTYSFSPLQKQLRQMALDTGLSPRSMLLYEQYKNTLPDLSLKRLNLPIFDFSIYRNAKGELRLPPVRITIKRNERQAADRHWQKMQEQRERKSSPKPPPDVDNPPEHKVSTDDFEDLSDYDGDSSSSVSSRSSSRISAESRSAGNSNRSSPVRQLNGSATSATGSRNSPVCLD